MLEINEFRSKLMQVLLQFLNLFLAFGFFFYRDQFLFENDSGAIVNLRI